MAKRLSMEPEYLTGRELAEAAGLSPSNATYYIARAGVRHVKEGRRGNMVAKLYDPRDVERLKEYAATRQRK